MKGAANCAIGPSSEWHEWRSRQAWQGADSAVKLALLPATVPVRVQGRVWEMGVGMIIPYLIQ